MPKNTNSMVERQLSHRTIREFTDQPVDDQTLETIYDVAMRTASSRGMQQASIIRVTETQLRERLAEIGNQEYVRRAPVYLLFLADTARNAQICRKTGATRGPPDARRLLWRPSPTLV